MKVKTLSRNQADFTRERPTDLQPVARSTKPSLHPLEKAREYARAVNAVKLDKHFSKPLVGALEGHLDAVCSMAKCPSVLNALATGSCDGEVIQWRLAQREPAWRVRAHRGFTRGLGYAPKGQTLLSCGDDKVVKLWLPASGSREPRAVFSSAHTTVDVDAHWGEQLFVSAGTELQVWDVSRSKPTHGFSWGSGSFTRARFNPVEHSVVLALSSDRGITVHDIRAGSSLRKVTMQTRANACAWNPMEAFNFVLASEDHNLYTFDMRKPSRALMVHEDHVAPVLDVDYSPTGTEFASGSYDRSVRVWGAQDGRSRTVYHTKRMQRIFCVRVSSDARFVVTGSDDTNVRLWKAKPNEKLGALLPREKSKAQYSQALVERHKHLPEVRRIARHQHVPKSILKAKRKKEIMKKAAQKKESNRRKHSKPGSHERVPAREARVWKVEQ